jgi:hypothetical protein
LIRTEFLQQLWKILGLFFVRKHPQNLFRILSEDLMETMQVLNSNRRSNNSCSSQIEKK